MNRRTFMGAALILVAAAGAVTVSILATSCSSGGCPMGSNCTMGQAGAPSANCCAPKGGDQVQATSIPAVNDKAAKPGATLVNARCPIMGGVVVDTQTRDYKGRKVGFCCPGCPAQWDKLTDEQKDAKLAKLAAQVPTQP